MADDNTVTQSAPAAPRAFLFTHKHTGAVEVHLIPDAFDLETWDRQPLCLAKMVPIGHQYRWKDWVTGQWSTWWNCLPGEVAALRVAASSGEYELREIYADTSNGV